MRVSCEKQRFEGLSVIRERAVGVVNGKLDIRLRTRYCNLLSNLYVGLPSPDSSLTQWVYPRPADEDNKQVRKYWQQVLKVLKKTSALELDMSCAVVRPCPPSKLIDPSSLRLIPGTGCFQG